MGFRVRGILEVSEGLAQEMLLPLQSAVRYAATAGPHRVRRNALSTMVGASQNFGSPTHAH
jgi:hypothetical protein